MLRCGYETNRGEREEIVLVLIISGCHVDNDYNLKKDSLREKGTHPPLFLCCCFHQQVGSCTPKVFFLLFLCIFFGSRKGAGKEAFEAAHLSSHQP